MLRCSSALPASDVSMDVVDLTAASPDESSSRAEEKFTAACDGCSHLPQGPRMPPPFRRTTQRSLSSSWGMQDKRPAADADAGTAATASGQSTQAGCGKHQSSAGRDPSKPSKSACPTVGNVVPDDSAKVPRGLDSKPVQQMESGNMMQVAAAQQPASQADSLPCNEAQACKICDPMAELAAAGLSIRSLKEALPEEIRWGQIRLAVAHIGRTGLLCRQVICHCAHNSLRCARCGLAARCKGQRAYIKA